MRILREGMEYGDLKRLVTPELRIDEYKSKMGEDKDIIVISMRVRGKEPALDLTNFIEKGYDWVLDADNSTGEMDDGDFIVFIEMQRTPAAPKQIMKFMEDLMNLTEQELNEWTVKYHKKKKSYSLNEDNIRAILPLTPAEYEKTFGQKSIDNLKTASGVKVKTKAPKNEHTEKIRTLAGIIR